MRYAVVTFMALLSVICSFAQLREIWREPNDRYSRTVGLAWDGLGGVYSLIARYTYGSPRSDGSSLNHEDILLTKRSDAGQKRWSHSYDYWHEDDIPRTMRFDSAGNVIVIGTSNGGHSSEGGSGTGDDIATLKFAPNGTLLWERRYSYDPPPADAGHARDSANDVAIDSDDNIIVIGRTWWVKSFGLALKYAPNGDLLWAKRIGDLNRFHDLSSYRVFVDSAQNITIVGYLVDNGWEQRGYPYLARFTPDGTLLWEKFLTSSTDAWSSPEGAWGDSEGNTTLLVGTGFPTGRDGLRILKLNAVGEVLWENGYSGMLGSLVAYDTVVDATRNCMYVLGGRSYSAWQLLGQKDLEVARISLETGQVEWASPAPLPEFPFSHPITFAQAIAVDARGSVYTTSFGANVIFDPDGNGYGPKTAVIHKFNEHGRLLWDYVDYRGWTVGWHVLLAKPLGFLYLGGNETIMAQVFASHPEGDSNLDGIIDDEDLTRILLAFGTADSLADIDENGIVDEADFTMALSNYGLGYDRSEGRGEGAKRR